MVPHVNSTFRTSSSTDAKRDEKHREGPTWWGTHVAPCVGGPRLEPHSAGQSNCFLLFETFCRNAVQHALMRVSLSHPTSGLTEQGIFSKDEARQLRSEGSREGVDDPTREIRDIVDGLADGLISVKQEPPNGMLIVIVSSPRLRAPIQFPMKSQKPHQIFMQRMMQYLTYTRLSLDASCKEHNSLNGQLETLNEALNKATVIKTGQDSSLSVGTRRLILEKYRKTERQL